MNLVGTIIAQNYLPQAIALYESYAKIYSKETFFVLITDSDSDHSNLFDGANVITPSDLNIPKEWLQGMERYYDTVEFATSLKPFFLMTLLSKGARTATFIDPDTLIFSEFAKAFTLAESQGVALTPHRLTPSDINSNHFNEESFLKYGVFNLGFISAGIRGLPILEWWAERLRWYSTKFPYSSFFTDQKWIDLVPAFFDFGVVREPTYNIAPWNIDERSLTSDGLDTYINGEKIVFVHFSQMSGALARGQLTFAWDKEIGDKEEFEQTLEIINKMTYDYSIKLLKLKKMLPNNFGGSLKKITPDYLYRRKMIAHEILMARSGKGVRVKSMPNKIRRRIYAKLLRLNISKALAEGIRLDLQAIKRRLR